jgi:hypothetical protein
MRMMGKHTPAKYAGYTKNDPLNGGIFFPASVLQCCISEGGVHERRR